MENTVYTLSTCPFCTKAKKLLDDLNVSYKEIGVDNDPEIWDDLKKMTNRTTVPQIFIKDKHIGGCDDLFVEHANGNLQKLLDN